MTVKMRKGYADPSGDEAVRLAKIAEDAGMCAVTVHGRTRAQGYMGQADWEAIGKVKRALKIPVLGNGDVNNAADAQKLIDISGCDGVMIGRGGLGNPWIYRSIENSLNGENSFVEPTLEEKRAAALKHFKLEVETEGERLALLKFRRIACWYFKEMPGSAIFRGKVQSIETEAEMREAIENFGAVN